MSSTCHCSTFTSDDSNDSRGDLDQESAAARGVDSFKEEVGDLRTNLSGLFDELRFDQLDQEAMEPHDQLQLILRLQSELSEMKKLLSARTPASVDLPDVSMETAPPSPKKQKSKTFAGNDIYPGLGAGFENFIHEFEHAIHTEELVNGSTWTNDLKVSVIVNFLEGKASRYYHKKNSEWQRRHDNANTPYADMKRAMRAEFGCKLSRLELSTKMKCNKREGDLWHEYLEYLNFIESLMEGGQTKMVMEVFGNNACPDLAPTLLASVPDDTQDYIAETDRMKRLLYKLRGDGRKFGTKRDDRKTRNSDRPNHSSHNDRSHDRNNRKNDDHSYRNPRNNNDNSEQTLPSTN
ncbi:Mitochondrial Carrier (MC) protein [Phytophthora megakarya]|uniref:Mitochondrial Carrier (MC) protein n=1 Tax=Phytophthora megakarya TaxID=4795 RepID=A0A225WEF2_9STRA|nr:Mitochondrial Carrier (MC) protein [Phytophthora megakarya]